MWTILERTTRIANPWLTVYEDRCRTSSGGRVDDYFTVRKPDYAQMVAVTEDGGFVLVKQYKHGAGRAVVEFPAGYLNEAEDSAGCAQRELLEETGYLAREIQPLGVLYTAPAILTNRAHVFLCQNLENTGQQRLDANEEIDVLTVPLEEILKRAPEEGFLDDVSSLASLYLALPHLRKGPSC